jgi:hypothetical protein
MHFSIPHTHQTSTKELLDELIVEVVHSSSSYTSEGSEFLDDAIRMKDQPLIYSEESIAASSPEYLF